jgi:hypothetical protein
MQQGAVKVAVVKKRCARTRVPGIEMQPPEATPYAHRYAHTSVRNSDQRHRKGRDRYRERDERDDKGPTRGGRERLLEWLGRTPELGPLFTAAGVTTPPR